MDSSGVGNSVVDDFGVDNSVPGKALADNYYSRDWIYDSSAVVAWRADDQYSDFPVAVGQWTPAENHRTPDCIVVAHKASDLQPNQQLANMMLASIS